MTFSSVTVRDSRGVLSKYTIQSGRVEETDGDAAIWLFVNPDESEKQMLTASFSVDEHTLQSALDPDELSRLEFEPGHVATIFKLPKNFHDPKHFVFGVSSMGLFLFKDKLIVVIPEEIPLFSAKVFSRVRSLTDVMLKIMGCCISHFFGHLKVINMVSAEIEKKMGTAVESGFLLDMFALEKSLVYYLNAIHTNSAFIARLKNSAGKIGFSPEEQELLDDLSVDNDQCYRQAEIYSNVLSSMMDARASIVNNNISVQVKLLSILALGIMVPTFVVSLFSMNVPLPFDIAEYKWTFWGIVGLCAASVIAFVYALRRKKW